ncbi:MAG: ATP-dependent DNA helicase [Candidatus Competibacteraceae bacterium]|jgi:ATP-dependent DNA helicase DinG|nr:ATP-dependent DNA helicase [Candidatus Competibacteraceae bacterium]
MQIAELLGADGPLARHIAGFAPRKQQQSMAQAVDAAVKARSMLLVEAGTGTGKTYAYLVPALLCGGKIIISTGTRNLQEQLYYKDLPVVCQALGITARRAMLKGRSNYLCQYRLERMETDGHWPRSRQAADFGHICTWARQTQTGDIAEVNAVAEDSSLWFQVTSTADNCLGQDCQYWAECHVVKARRKALDADILVINHHLFFADMVVKEEGFGELLPEAEAFILDEAHQLPDVASHFFGLSLSSRQLRELVQDSITEQARDAPDFRDLAERARRLDKATADLRLALGHDKRRAPWSEVASSSTVDDATVNLRESLQALQQGLAEAAQRGTGLDNCRKRCEALTERLSLLINPAEIDGIHWFETHTRSFILHLTPLNIAPHFHTHRVTYQSAWIFTSATLAVGDSFDHFADRLGLKDPQSLRLDSPFDFAHNALLYHPPDLPMPSSPNYIEKLVEAAMPVLDASQARAFMLFTSYRSLQQAAELLSDRLRYPILIQGTMPKNELLVTFRDLGNAVLLGTASFWGGVDVRGEALSCVIIDKLPFASPGDPIVRGHIESMRQRDEDPFLGYQIPQAVITLKQGAGRLIRDINDRGVLMIGDPRLLSRSYGRFFLDSLPPMRRTGLLDEVRAFFAGQDEPVTTLDSL